VWLCRDARPINRNEIKPGTCNCFQTIADLLMQFGVLTQLVALAIPTAPHQRSVYRVSVAYRIPPALTL
jgi:hypothetical protein